MELRNNIEAYIKRAVSECEYSYLFREPLIGYSSPDDQLYQEIKVHAGSQHLYPREILPEVETIISFFVPLSYGVVERNRLKGEVSEEYATSYIEANKLINEISQGIIDYLTGQQFLAEMIRATHTYDAEILKASWSHRSAAYIAGLGRFGLNRLLITPKGCAGRYGTVFTSAKIDYIKEDLSEQCLYFKNGSCKYCIKNCPTGALTEAGIDRHKCNDYLLEVDKNFSHLETCDVCGKCLTGPCANR